MIKMVRGYGPPPQDAGMDYAGYGVAARELPNPVSQMAPWPSARAQGLMRAVPALNGYRGCGCNQSAYGEPEGALGAFGPLFVLGGLWALYQFTR